MTVKQQLDALFAEMTSKLGTTYFEMTSSAQVVYHYTTAEALVSIVKSTSLRASNVLFMNDPLELRFAIGLATDIINGTKHGNSPEADDTIRKYYETYFTTKLQPRKQRQFVLSFSLNPDSLHLWNTYTGHEGYALGYKLVDFARGLFSLDAVDTSTKSLRLAQRGSYVFGDYSLYCIKILYSPEKQKELIQETIRYIDQAMLLVASQRPIASSDQLQEQMVRFLQFFVTVLYSLKPQGHEIEQEFRVVLLPDPGFDGVEYVVRNGIVTPYITLGNVNDVLSEIVIGPKMRDEAAEAGLRNFLDSCSLQKVCISHSAIRLR